MFNLAAWRHTLLIHFMSSVSFCSVDFKKVNLRETECSNVGVALNVFHHQQSFVRIPTMNVLEPVFFFFYLLKTNFLWLDEVKGHAFDLLPIKCLTSASAPVCPSNHCLSVCLWVRPFGASASTKAVCFVLFLFHFEAKLPPRKLFASCGSHSQRLHTPSVRTVVLVI